MIEFLKKQETKLVLFGIAFTLVGWVMSQIHTHGQDIAAVKVYVEKQGEAIAQMSPLPQTMASMEERQETLDENHAIIFQNLNNMDERLDEHDTRLTVIESKIGQEDS